MADQASSTITIDADPAAVMAVIADFEHYPEWSGYIKTAEVVSSDAKGQAEEVHFILDAGVVKDDYVLGYDWDADREVRWTLVRGKALKAMDGSYTLKPTGSGTEVVYRLSVDLNLPMLGMFKRKAEKVIMDTALKELKKRVEGA
jgi:carbon monoxide dehydrogenase subunit G